MSNIKVLGLFPHPIEGASSRFRGYSYQDSLVHHGIELHARSFLSSEVFLRRQKFGNIDLNVLIGILDGFAGRFVQSLSARRGYDAIYIQRQAFPLFHRQMDKLFINSSIPIIFDMDDAVFTEYHIDHLLRASTAVTVGNSFLAQYVRGVAPEVPITLIPTTVDLDSYSVAPPKIAKQPLIVGWIGTSSTFHRYLLPVLPALVETTKRYSGEFKVVASPDVKTAVVDAGAIFVPWSLSTEVQQIQSFDVGMMPLHDDEYVRGKCAFKLIQYGAVGLPSVGTDIGANREVVEHGVTGLLSETPEDMQKQLESLLSSADLRQKMGLAARQRVEERFSLQSQVGVMAEVFRQAVAGGKSVRN